MTALSRRILHEITRFAVLQGAATLLSLATGIVLARVLARHDFGVYGICSFYIGLGALIGDGGLGAALLRRKRDVRNEHYRVAMTTLVGLSMALAGTLALASRWIGRHNHLTGSESYALLAMAPLFVTSALRVVPLVRLERELRFARIARIELTAAVVRHVTAISIAVTTGGVWALVLSALAGSAVHVVLAYRASPGWVGLGWSSRILRSLIAHGGKVQALNICAYLKDNVSRALLGATAGPGAVSLFDFGVSYIQSPVVAVNTLSRVQLAVYSRLDAADPTLYLALRGALRAAVVGGTPLLCALALASPWLVPTVYASKWIGAVPVIWGLLPNMIGGLCASPLLTLMQGQGRAGFAVLVFFAWTALTWALAIVAIVAAPGDLGALALAHSAVTVVVVTVLLASAGRQVRQGLFSVLFPPLGAGAAGLSAGLAAAWLGSGWLRHPLSAAAASAAAYVVALLALDRQQLAADIRAAVGALRR